MSISDWPVNEKPREKLLQKGAASLSDAELLAIFSVQAQKGNPLLIWPASCSGKTAI